MQWAVILKRLYDKNEIDEEVLDNCITDGLIDENDKSEIIGV